MAKIQLLLLNRRKKMSVVLDALNIDEVRRIQIIGDKIGGIAVRFFDT